MTKEEFESLTNRNSNAIISVDDLKNKENRTLIYGYTLDRSTHHVYLKDGRIYCCVYDDDIIKREVVWNDDYVPDKRIYPARSDYEFCLLLKLAGVYLPFTNFNEMEIDVYKDEDEDEEYYYHGRILK